MDLEKLKQEADIHTYELSEDQQIRNNILSSLQELYKLMDSFNSGWREKMKAFVELFLSECSELLEENGFKVMRQNCTGELPDGESLLAVYNGAMIKISNINYKSQPVQIQSSNRNTISFSFGTPLDVPNYYLWETHVDICGTKLYMLPKDAEEVYKHFVENVCIDELYVIQDEIDGNINHYKRGIMDMEFISLCIYNHDKTERYDSFKNFWDVI